MRTANETKIHSNKESSNSNPRRSRREIHAASVDPMTKRINIADSDDASFREVKGSPMQKREVISGEYPLGGSESQPKSLPESAAAPASSGWSTLSSDPRFIADESRIIAAAPVWNRSTQSANARILAILILGLACIGTVSELIRYGSINVLSTTTLGSAVLVLFSALCWRFSKSDPRDDRSTLGASKIHRTRTGLG